MLLIKRLWIIKVNEHYRLTIKYELNVARAQFLALVKKLSITWYVLKIASLLYNLYERHL